MEEEKIRGAEEFMRFVEVIDSIPVTAERIAQNSVASIGCDGQVLFIY